MDKQTGKLLVLGGFALRLCLEGFRYILKLLAMSKIDLLRRLLRMLTGDFIGSLYNLASMVAVIVIIAGFFIVFCSERSFIDLALAIFFTWDFISLTSSIIHHGLSELEASQINLSNILDAPQSTFGPNLIFVIIITFLWVWKLDSGGMRLASYLVSTGLLFSYTAPLFFTDLSILTMLLEYFNVGALLSKLIISGILSIPVIAEALLVVVAFIDFNHE